MLTSKVKRTSRSEASRMLRPWTTPALLMRMVGSPMVWRISVATAAMALGEVMSHLKKWTVGPGGLC